MTDHTLSHAASLGEFKAASFIRHIARNWRARGAVAKLEFLNDGLLSDIGLDRSDVRWAMQLPLTVNAEMALKGRVCRSGGLR
jgi:uncharacterized protein YjiS (DUF1127 family)